MVVQAYLNGKPITKEECKNYDILNDRAKQIILQAMRRVEAERMEKEQKETEQKGEKGGQA